MCHTVKVGYEINFLCSEVSISIVFLTAVKLLHSVSRMIANKIGHGKVYTTVLMQYYT